MTGSRYDTSATHRSLSVTEPSPCAGPSMLSPKDFAALLKSHPSSDILLLDLRVFPAFSKSRVQGALNLCIPTTLLKRPSFNVQKLSETFKKSHDRAKFARWRDVRLIVVYDASSSLLKDAVSSVNTVKKFIQEGWCGLAYVLTGGFPSFAKQFPELLDEDPPGAGSPSDDTTDPAQYENQDAIGVAGGCLMPVNQTVADPFVGTIRQNIELAGGVGEINVRLPGGLEQRKPGTRVPPHWVMALIREDGLSHKVASRFLHIEEAEQKRMQRALAPSVSFIPNKRELAFSPKSRIQSTPAPSVGATPLTAATPFTTFNSSAQSTPKATMPARLPDIISPPSISLAGIEKGAKNKYKDMLPYNHSRVRLANVSQGGCDYVNASHIRSTLSGKEYIAAQAPTPPTFGDFWRVVWEQEVRFIVMLTAETEGGQIKCHRYWSDGQYGSFRIRETQADLPPCPRQAKTRVLNLSNGALTRTIVHMHYLDWPDFGTIEPWQLLSFVEYSNSVQTAQNSVQKPVSSSRSPVLVHCSAGCGRTGTYCTIDSVISTIEGGTYDDTEEDLIARTVEDFRAQRLSMVQTLRQFVLCYETVMQWFWGMKDEKV